MTDAAPPSDPTAHLLEAWSNALPGILSMLDSQQRDLFRHELQRLCAYDRIGSPEAPAVGEQVGKLLLEAARAARVPAAVSALRSVADDPNSVVRLSEHLMAQWRTAEKGLLRPECAPDGLHGEPIFGPRLGGPGRPGGLSRPESPRGGGPDESAAPPQGGTRNPGETESEDSS